MEQNFVSETGIGIEECKWKTERLLFSKRNPKIKKASAKASENSLLLIVTNY